MIFCPTKAVVSGNLTLRSAGYFLMGPEQKWQTHTNINTYNNNNNKLHRNSIVQHIFGLWVKKKNPPKVLVFLLVEQKVLVCIKTILRTDFIYSCFETAVINFAAIFKLRCSKLYSCSCKHNFRKLYIATGFASHSYCHLAIGQQKQKQLVTSNLTLTQVVDCLNTH